MQHAVVEQVGRFINEVVKHVAFQDRRAGFPFPRPIFQLKALGQHRFQITVLVILEAFNLHVA